MLIQIYHNPRCSTSRKALAIIQDEGHTAQEVRYLDDPPSVAEFKLLLSKLNVGPQDVLRKRETLYKEKFKDKNFTEDEWIDIMLENPKLIERPIVIRGNKAVIGRPIEKVLELIS